MRDMQNNKQELYGSCFFGSSSMYVFDFGLFFAPPRLQVNGAMYFSLFSFPILVMVLSSYTIYVGSTAGLLRSLITSTANRSSR